MKKESITQRQAVSMIGLFIVGSSLVFGISRKSGQDSWIGLLISIAAMMPVIYIYARLLGRYPGRGLFDICTDVFGKVIGKIIIVLLVWYALHLGSLVMRDYSEFIQVTTFNEMPQTISLLCSAFLSIWVARRGVEVLGRWSSVVFPVLIFMVAVTVLLLVKDMHVSNLLPVGENLDTVPEDALVDFTFPFAETVLFLCVMNTLKTDSKPGRAWTYGILAGGAVLLFGGFLRNLLVLGFPMLGDAAFPSQLAVSVIIAGNFVSRIEGVVGANLLMAGFVKISICLIAAAKGTARLFDADDYKPYVASLGLLMVALASIMYKSTMEMFAFIGVYKFYALPFQLIIPLLLCITAEIKFIIKSKKEEKPA